MSEASLYTRLGGYDARAAVDDLLVRVRADGLLGRFWASPRSDATDNGERQLTLDFMVAATGGPAFYTGRRVRPILKPTPMFVSRTQSHARWTLAVIPENAFAIADARDARETTASLRRLGRATKSRTRQMRICPYVTGFR